MMTVRQWVEFMGQDENTFFGLELENGFPCKTYLEKNDFLLKMDGWLEDIVVKAYPYNLRRDEKNYCLLIYRA